MNKIKVCTTFSGYDSQCLALKYAGIPFELVAWSEIDKHAIKAHNALFPEYADRNLGDITKVDWGGVPDFDLLTYSSPCQDISNAGMQRGLEKGSGTRSSLLWEVEKAIIAKRPQFLLMENVAALVTDKFVKDFNSWLVTLESYGYTNHWKVLNAKDYGVPQNRERVFVVSILGEHQPYYFPNAVRLEKRLKDVLEGQVDAKYYLRQELVESMKAHCERKQAEGCGFKFDPKDGNAIANSITTHSGSRETDNHIRTKCLNSKVNGKQPSLEDRVYDTDGIATALTTGFHPSIKVVGKWSPSSQSNGNVYDAEGISPTIVCGAHGEGEPRVRVGAIRGRGEQNRQTLEVKDEMVTNALTSVQKDNVILSDFRIRKLTERECFRLMGVREDDIDKLLKAGISKTQLYKLAGNSIVCDVLMAIFDRMLVNTSPVKGEQLSIF